MGQRARARAEVRCGRAFVPTAEIGEQDGVRAVAEVGPVLYQPVSGRRQVVYLFTFVQHTSYSVSGPRARRGRIT